MNDFQGKLDIIYNQVESQLSIKLLNEGFQLQKQIISEEAFGSRLTEWRNREEKQALRFVWDGKDYYFVIEESPFSDDIEPNSWADIIFIPFDRENNSHNYISSIIRDLVAEI